MMNKFIFFVLVGSLAGLISSVSFAGQGTGKEGAACTQGSDDCGTGYACSSDGKCEMPGPAVL